jgi:hypothetical protein
MPSEIQSVYFMDNSWTPTTARQWLKSHNIRPIKGVQHNGYQFRYRIREPELYRRFATKMLGDDIYLVLGIY